MSFAVKCFWVLPYHCFLPVCRTATLLSIPVLKKKLRPKSRSSKQTVLPFPALFSIVIFSYPGKKASGHGADNILVNVLPVAATSGDEKPEEAEAEVAIAKETA